MAQTKAQLIAEAKSIGIPAQRLTGTKAQIQQKIDSYSAALAESAADTVQAISAAPAAPEVPAATAAQRPSIHPAIPAAIGGLAGAAWHFLG